MNWIYESVHWEKFECKNGIFISQNNAEIVNYKEENRDFLFKLEEDSYWFQHRNNMIKAVVDKFPPLNCELVEVGAGNGNTSKFMQERGYKVAAFEPGYEGALNSKKRNVHPVFCSMYNTEQVKESSISSVGLFDVLEHIDDDLLFLNDINKTLKSSGKIYVTVPAYQFLWSEVDNLDHKRRYNKNSLEKLFQEAGFNILYSSYFFSFLIPFIFFFQNTSL